MKVYKKEKEMLTNWGYTEDDIQQIERLKYDFTLYDEKYGENNSKKITQKQARELLSLEDFLSGIARAAFHWTAARNNILIRSNLF